VGTYTVKITDNNTGCVTVLEEDVLDARTPPIIVIVEDNPLINCDPLRPNGQLSATADGGQVVGYDFAWFAGVTASGSTVATNNKLIGHTAGEYTVRVTNQFTGCFADDLGEITDGTVLPPIPDGELKRHREHCVNPDGWVAASVGGVVVNYIFDWYDGTDVSGTPDFSGVHYQDRDIGVYSVVATDIVTGCVSPPDTVHVNDHRRYPELFFKTTPSYCDELPGSFGGNGSAEVELRPADILSDSIKWNAVETGQVFVGSYITGVLPGQYDVLVVTLKGCEKEGSVTVPTEVLEYNLLTMNGDGKNDNFKVDCITRFPNNNVKIFNRSGVLVYEADGYNNNDVVFEGIGKNGVYPAGNELPVGTYFYIVDKRDGSKPKTGYLELVK
jgi:gliding motility-associated-like protein